uniref:Uncharacterized protein n=1 Tax=Acrobeloides nanus TaxID=290746 RepID=A0A914DJB2_9BILA
MTQQQLLKLKLSNNAIKIVRVAIVQGLKDRFGELYKKKNHALAHFLDPRFKDLNVPSSTAFVRVVTEWLDENDYSAVKENEGHELEITEPLVKKSKVGLLESFEESLGQLDHR